MPVDREAVRKPAKWERSPAQHFGLFAAIAIVTVLAANVSALPSAKAPVGPAAMQRGGIYRRGQQRPPRKSSIDMQVDRVGKRLELSELQRFDLRKLLESQQARANRLWRDPQIAPIERMNQLRVLHETTQKQFRAMLTKEQRKKYDQMLAQSARASAVEQQPSNSQTPK